MRRLSVIVLLFSATACVDFGAALEECQATGKCEGAPAGDSGTGPSADSGVSADAGSDAGTVDAGCVDMDLDGLGPGCAAPDCDDLDGQRPLQLPCREGAYVCKSCAGASDNNSGGPTAPLLTISQGIQYARALGTDVYVANRDRFRTAIYDENVTMTDGVSVLGRYYVEEDGGWSAGGSVRTSLRPKRTEGVLFSGAISRETKLAGFSVESVGGDGGTGITIIGGSPTIEDVSVGYPVEPVTLRSYGVIVEGLDGGARPSPRFVNTIIYAVRGSTQAVGLYIKHGSVQMEGGIAYGGSIGEGGAGLGVWMEDGRGSSFSGVTTVGCVGNPTGLNQTLCKAVYSTGDVSGVVFGGSPAYGCYDNCGASSTSESVGFDIQYCGGAWDGGAPMVVAGSGQVYGAVASSNGGIGRGFRIGEGCAIEIRDNQQIVGATTATVNPNGIRCTFGVGGQYPAHCFIRRNGIISHINGGPANAIGVYCAGGCDEVSQNDIDVYGVGVTTFYTLQVEGGSPLISRNKINMNAADTTCQIGRGIWLNNTTARVENNFIRGGSCGNGVGIQHTVTSGPGADIHSNSIAGGDSASTVGFGIYFQGPAGVPAGKVWNNIISSGNTPGGATTRAAIGYETTATPLEVQNNLLHSNSGGVLVVTNWGGSATGYNASTLNATTWAEANIDAAADPGFKSWKNFHLTPASLAIDAGTRVGAPDQDIDGDKRPKPDAGYSPAIGADEP